MKKVSSDKNMSGYAKTTIIHNLGCCLCDTANSEIKTMIKQIGDDFTTLVFNYQPTITNKTHLKILYEAFKQSKDYSCGSIGADVANETGINFCIQSFICEMISAAYKADCFIEDVFIERLFSSQNKELPANIKAFYFAYFKIFSTDADYAELKEKIIANGI